MGRVACASYVISTEVSCSVELPRSLEINHGQLENSHLFTDSCGECLQKFVRFFRFVSSNYFRRPDGERLSGGESWKRTIIIHLTPSCKIITRKLTHEELVHRVKLKIPYLFVLLVQILVATFGTRNCVNKIASSETIDHFSSRR